MKTKHFALALSPLLAILLAPSLSQAAWSDTAANQNYYRPFVDYSVTSLSNGYQLEVSSERSQTQDRIQDNAEARAAKSRARIDKTVNTTNNGITVTKTTDSPYLGNRLERRATYPKATIYRFNNRDQ
jgi:hypothetical protein